MSNYCLDLAGTSDDQLLRSLIGEDSMAGPVSIAFGREPSYFYGADVLGPFHQTLIARHIESGEVIGMVTRAVRPGFINGTVTSVGYISGLRIKKPYRGGMLLARGCTYFKTLHQDMRAPFYIVSIVENNTRAIELVTSNRAGLPVGRDLGRLTVSAVAIGRQKASTAGNIRILKGTSDLAGEIAGCLQNYGSEKQFYPYVAKEDLLGENESLRNLSPGNFYVAVLKDKVVGVAGKWDQRSFKQTIIRGYSGKMKWIRPAYNLAAVLGGFTTLPAPGRQLDSFYCSFIAVKQNEPQIFQSLLREMYNDAVDKGYSYLLVGLHESDRLGAVLKEYRKISYASRLFALCWEDGAEACHSIDGRSPYFETAIL